MDEEELKANNLKALRPNLRQADFICVKCKHQPRLWASYGMHTGDEAGNPNGGGAIHGYLECHGDKMEILISFAETNNFLNAGEKIPVFDNVNQFHPKRLFDPTDNVLRGPEASGGLILPG